MRQEQPTVRESNRSICEMTEMGEIIERRGCCWRRRVSFVGSEGKCECFGDAGDGKAAE